MPRASMAGLIAQLRDLIGDPAGASPRWTDDQLERALDRRKSWAHSGQLDGFRTSSALAGYDVFTSPFDAWEADRVLRDGNGVALVPLTSDDLGGRWTFAPRQLGVYITGATYDLAAAGADVLEQWATALAREYDFSADGASRARSQKATQLRASARALRQAQRPGSIAADRTDVAPAVSRW